MNKKKFISVANDVINLEIKALQKLKKNINAANYFLKNFTYKKYKVKAPSTYGITIR